MAKYLPLPKSLNEADKTLISDVITATEHQFKGDLFGETNAPLTESYVTPDGRYYWSSNGELRTYVTNLTNTNDVRSANGVLYKTLSAAPEYSEPTTAGAPEQVDSNSVSVSTGSLEQFEKEKEIRSAAKAQADLKAKQDVEASIKRQLEIHTQEIQKAKVAEARLKVENKKIYYKAEAQEKAFLTTKQMQALETLKQQANSAPEETFKQIKQSIQNKVQGVPEGAADKAAYDILEDLRSDSETAAKDAAFREMSSKPELFGKEEELFAWTKELSNEKANRLALDQKLAEATFGKEFASNIVPKYKIQISETPEPGFNRRINFEEIPQQRISTLNDRSSFLQSFSGNFVKSEVESRAYSFIGEKIEQQVLNMVAKGTISEGAGSLINTALSVFGATAPMEWVVIEGSMVGEFAMATGMGPTFGFLGQLTGSSFFGITEVAATAAATTTATVGSVGTTVTVGGIGAAATTAVTTGVTSTAVAGTTAAVTATTAAGIGAAAGSVVPVAGTILGWVAGFIAGLGLGKLAEKIPWHKIKDFVIAVPGGILGVAVGGVYGGVVGYTGAFMLSRFLGGGLPAMQSSLSSFGSGVINVTSAIGSTFMEGVGKPILIMFLIFPPIVALILFIINSGAYLVPPGALQTSSTNPYISVVKTANPSGQLPSPTDVTYTITIAAKKDILTGITLKNTCKSIGKSGISVNCEDLEKMPAPADIPTQISPGAPFTFTFTSTYDNKYQNSLVSDKVTVNAVSASGGKVSEVGSASVCFGECPLDCFAFPESYWPENSDVQKLKSLLTEAISTLVGEYSNFTQKVCAGGTVNLCYNPSKLSPGIWGFHEHSPTCDIDFGSQVTSYGSEGVLFLLTHEVTHHIQNIDPGSFSQFMDKVNPPQSEPYVCTRGSDNPYESMAEAAALFVAKPIIDKNASCLTTSFQSQYPKHYNFTKAVMFGP